MRSPIRSIAVVLCGLWVAAASLRAQPAPPSAAELAQERAQLTQWKADRVTSLTSETGWLTLSGLYWLKPGDNTFGSASTNTLRLDNAAFPAVAGRFVVNGDKVRFVAAANSGVTHEGKAVAELDLVSDLKGEPTLLQSGTVTFYLIDRTGKLGVRVRDSANPHRQQFAGLEYFPVDDSWVVNARFEPYTPAKAISIVNILGMREDLQAPGALVFNRGGKEYRLDALLETPDATELFLMLADGTTGEETYGAGRYMYVSLPKDGTVRLNFNQAYNPPCAFNDFATCPLPPAQNRLMSLRIEAGEKTYRPGH